MKKILSTIFVILFSIVLYGQKIPNSQVKSLDNKIVDVSTIVENGSEPVLICFFATWCKPCVKELDAFSDEYIDWVDETGVKIIAISVDNVRSSSSVSPFINARGWEFEVYLDPNSDFKRALNVSNIPHTLLVVNGKIVWQHTSYLEGDEDEVYEMIKQY